MGDDLPAVELGTDKTALAVTTGVDHTCALLNDGSVKCWGLNNSGQLGLGDTDPRGDQPNEMGDNLPVVSLGKDKSATAISAGQQGHSCVILSDASVKCWGYAAYGQLGLGDVEDRGGAPGEMGDSLPAVSLGTEKTAVAITTGALHVCAILNDASVKCWGYNSSFQLGIGVDENRGDQPNEMGDNLPAAKMFSMLW
jgi:alpha-tubulin suppressor-like RCC1 family protein